MSKDKFLQLQLNEAGDERSYVASLSLGERGIRVHC
jgi:hypothetical protein